MVLLDQLSDRCSYFRRENKVAQAALRVDLKYQFPHRWRYRLGNESLVGAIGGDQCRQAICQHMVALGAFLGDDCLDKSPESSLVAVAFGFDEVNQQI